MFNSEKAKGKEIEENEEKGAFVFIKKLWSNFSLTDMSALSDEEISSPPKEGGLSSPPKEGRLSPPPKEGRFSPPPKEGRFSPPPKEGRFSPPPKEGRFSPPPKEGRFSPPPKEERLSSSPPADERFSSSPPKVEFTVSSSASSSSTRSHSSRKRSTSISKKESAEEGKKIDKSKVRPGAVTPRNKRNSLPRATLSLVNHSEMIKELNDTSDLGEISQDPKENCKQLLAAKKIGTFIKLFNAIPPDILIDYINERAGKDGIKVLQDFQKKIQEIAKTTDLNLPIEILAGDFQELLINKGLSSQLDDKKFNFEGLKGEERLKAISQTVKIELTKIFKDKPYSQGLAEMLYTLCMGLNDEERKFDNEIIRRIVVGLMSKYSSLEMFNILKEIFPHLSSIHQWVVIFIIKEMILWDEFHHIYRENILVEPFIDDKEIRNALNQIVQFKREKEASLFQMNNKISTIIAKCYKCYRSPTSQAANATELENIATIEQLMNQDKYYGSQERANHLRAMTLLHYQTLNFKELAEEIADVNKALHGERVKFFNALSNYVVVDILNQRSPKERIARLGSYIRTLTALFKSSKPDLHSAMIISSAIHCSWISSLHKNLNEEEKGELKKIDDKLSSKNNFSQQRLLMENMLTLPYVGILSRDIVFAGENVAISKFEVVGKVYLETIKRQDKLKEIFLPIEPALYAIAQTHRILSDDEMKCISKKPFVLDATTTIAGLESVFEYFFKNKENELVFSYNGEIGDKQTSVKLLFQWLTECFREKEDTTVTLRAINYAMKYFGEPIVSKYQQELADSLLYKNPFVLDGKTTIAGLESVFKYFLKKKGNDLVFSYQGEAGDRETSVKLLFKWLGECFSDEDTTVTLKTINYAMEYFGKHLVSKYQEKLALSLMQKKPQIAPQFQRAKATPPGMQLSCSPPSSAEPCFSPTDKNTRRDKASLN